MIKDHLCLLLLGPGNSHLLSSFLFRDLFMCDEHFVCERSFTSSPCLPSTSWVCFQWLFSLSRDPCYLCTQKRFIVFCHCLFLNFGWGRLYFPKWSKDLPFHTFFLQHDWIMGCHNKGPQAWWLKQQEFIVSQFWKLEVLDEGFGRVDGL